MKRYIGYLCDTLIAHGVPVGNRFPALIPPVDPRAPANLIAAIQDAARQAYMGGDKGSPQLICCVLPGRSANHRVICTQADRQGCVAVRDHQESLFHRTQR